MPDKAVMLAVLDSIYQARVKGDKTALDAHWAEDGHYRMACEPDLLTPFPSQSMAGPGATDALVDMFQFHRIERIDTVVEGSTAVATVRATVIYRSLEPVATEICDVWKFDDAGKVASLVQFGDTALIRQQMSLAAS